MNQRNNISAKPFALGTLFKECQHCQNCFSTICTKLVSMEKTYIPFILRNLLFFHVMKRLTKVRLKWTQSFKWSTQVVFSRALEQVSRCHMFRDVYKSQSGLNRFWPLNCIYNAGSPSKLVTHFLSITLAENSSRAISMLMHLVFLQFPKGTNTNRLKQFISTPLNHSGCKSQGTDWLWDNSGCRRFWASPSQGMPVLGWGRLLLFFIYTWGNKGFATKTHPVSSQNTLWKGQTK